MKKAGFASLLLFVTAFLAVDSRAVGAQSEGGTNDQSGGEAAPAADDSQPSGKSAEALLREVTTPDMVQAIEGGLKTLAELLTDEGFFQPDGNGSPVIATTALGGLALLASGSVPGSGPYGEHLTKITKFLLLNQDPNTGYFRREGDSTSRIHGHSFATLYMSQVLGHAIDEFQVGEKKLSVKGALTRGAKLLETGQTKDGGWGYHPDDLSWDEGSTTICALQGLRGAQGVGIKVANESIAKAIGYIEKIAVPQSFVDNEGNLRQGYTFMYSYGSGASSNSWALVAAACASLNNLGVYHKYAQWNEKNLGAILDGGMRWLRYQQDNFLERYQKGAGALDTSHFYYANFYACQACWQYSDIEYFRAYFPKVRDILVKAWKTGGNKGWQESRYGMAHGTAFSLLTLQVPYQYLPVFQR